MQPTVESRRKRCDQLRAQLQADRQSFIPQYQDLSDYVSPMRARFTISENNKGNRKNQKIVDSTATMALRTLSSGMMAGLTSPARPWFRLTVPDPDLAELESVKWWLDTVTKRMTATLLRSNFYNVLPIIYEDMGQFGTSALYVEEDFEDVVRFYPFPVGTYFIACDHKGRVDTFMRDFRMTVKQLVTRFGYDDGMGGKANEIDWGKFSESVKQMWDEGNREQWIEVSHAVYPNEEYDPKKLHSKYKKFCSLYFERGNSAKGSGSVDCDKMLSEKGTDYFPVLCPRWKVSAEDAYATSCPGMDAIGDVKQLQLGERRSMQAIEKMVNPPMVAPSSMRNQKMSLLPGDTSFVDTREGQQGFKPVFEINPKIAELETKQDACRYRIKRCYYEDAFLLISEMDRRNVTATEIDQRKEEKLLVLGPVLEQTSQDLLNPTIDIVFDLMHAQGEIPEPPPELQGKPLKVEYMSIMAQAQKAYGLAGLERFVRSAAGIHTVQPDTIHKVNYDEILNVVGEMTSVPAHVLRPDDEVAKIRQQIAQGQQQQAQQQSIQNAAGTARDLSQAQISDDNALGQMIQMAKTGQLVPQQ